ncbi:MAG: DinB family protein [Parafilimonas sp.]
MTTEKLIPITIGAKELFASLDDTASELLKLISSADEKTISIIPFEDSWTAAQLAAHVTKSNQAIAQALNMQGKTAERNPAERAQELKAIFLDFTTKFQSPEFILPAQDTYQKETLIADFKKSIEQLKEMSTKADLSEIISVPAFGEITKFELLYFVLYHTQRHIHQLKNIFKIIENK